MPIITPDDEFREAFSHNSHSGQHPQGPAQGHHHHPQPQHPSPKQEHGQESQKPEVGLEPQNPEEGQDPQIRPKEGHGHEFKKPEEDTEPQKSVEEQDLKIKPKQGQEHGSQNSQKDPDTVVPVHPIGQPIGEFESQDVKDILDILNFRDIFLENIGKENDILGNNNNHRLQLEDPITTVKLSSSQIRGFELEALIEIEEDIGDGQGLRLGSSAHLNQNKAKPPEPTPYFCGLLPCHQFKVGLNLKNDWMVQAGFFSKIMLVKAIQLAMISIWIVLIGNFPKLEEFMIAHSDWSYLALGIFFIIIIAVRITARKKAKWHRLMIIWALLAVTSSMGFALGAFTYKHRVQAIPTTVWILLFTFLILCFTPYMSQVPITKIVTLKTAAIVVLLVSMVIILIRIYTLNDLDITDVTTYVLLPSILAAEAITWVTIVEIQRIILGSSFHVSEKRWFFATLYV